MSLGTKRMSYKNIKVTNHAKQRAYERLSLIKESDIQKLAYNARYNGVKIKRLNENNYQEMGVSYVMYRYLKNHYAHHFISEKMYFYKNFVYIFAGEKSHSLKSIVPCNEKDARLAVEKINLSKGRIKIKNELCLE